MFVCESCQKSVFTPVCSDCAPSPRDDWHVTEFPGVETSEDRNRRGFIPRLKHREPPPPFRSRLAEYCDTNESEVMQDHPQESSMPFRQFTLIGPYIGAKPAKLIRYLLERIRACIRSA